MVTPEGLFEKLISMAEKQYSKEDIEKITFAYHFAVKAHGEQKRDSGEPYVTHPISVAIILVEFGMDTACIISGLLHDVVEDTEVTEKEITKIFGKEIFELVDGVTKLGKIPYSTREEQQAENIRKMLIAMAKDIRVIVIKLADRLHNMRTIDGVSEVRRLNKAQENMEIYAPLAHRLGMRRVKDELEDKCLRVLDPIAYKEVEDNLNSHKDDRQTILESIKEKVLSRLNEAGIKAHIEGRVKSVYGIYRKVYIQCKEFDEIYDIYAIRVIVESVNDCYNVLGVLHDLMHPIPGRFKDYISTPKPNMYQSLHSTLIGKEGVPFEVQIRTWDMHYTAEYGIAAHWKYKAGINGKDSLEERLAWVRQLLEIQNDADDAEDFVKSLKTDLAIDEVFVFTPKGDIINLPINSTVIDFAYAIHSQVGNRMAGAKVNGKIVSLDYKVRNGEIVEIITSSGEGHGPNRQWLKLCKTSEARSKIRQWFKKERRAENIEEGKNELEREFKRNSIRLNKEEQEGFITQIAERQHCQSVEDFYAAIGYGGVSLSKIIPRLREEYKKIVAARSEAVVEISNTHKRSNGGVIIAGLDDCLIKFAKCCNPLPGDEIVGFITRGSGVSVHKCDCPNAFSAMERGDEPERWVKATWDSGVNESFKSSISVLCSDRYGMLADIAGTLAGMHVMINSVNARAVSDGNSLVDLMIVVDSVAHLDFVKQRLLKIDGVIEITRTIN